MIKSRFSILLSTLFCFAAQLTNAQSTRTIEFYDSIKNYDLSTLWRADSLLNLEWVDDTMYFDPKMIVFPEPLGFIGDDFQRFYIHFVSVSKDKSKPYQYDVLGKTKVKNTICSFKGTIIIYKSIIRRVEHDPPIKRGILSCHYRFYEDHNTIESGYFEGELISNWCIYDRHILYDNIHSVSDGYCNNQFTGTWKSYKTNVVKKCHWGDFRIPDCGDLDVGAGDFGVNEKYRNNGWQSYMKSTGPTENDQWWK